MISDALTTSTRTITSHLRDADRLRLDLPVSPETGLSQPSQIMIDKAQTTIRSKLGAVVGSVDRETMKAVDRTLAVFFGIA